MPDSPTGVANDRRFDVCIVGAGPAASTAAYLLARQGRSVALVDRARFPRDKVCGDGITPRGARVLGRIGVLDAVAAAGFSCRGVDVWGEGLAKRRVAFTMRFDRGRDGEPSDLIVAPRLALDDLLLRHALEAGPTHVDGTKVVDIREDADGVRVIGDDGTSIAASIAIVATGAESQLLRACGLLAEKPPLEHAARAYYDGVEGLSDRIVLFFDGVDLPGYGWIFPTSPTSANIGCGVFAQGHGGGPRKKPMPQAQRLEQLVASHPTLSTMLRHATPAGPIRAYPLRTDFRKEFAGAGRLLVVGEAAGLVNPITGEGIDYALESAEFVADAVAARWPRAAAHVDTETAHRLLEHYRASLSRRFTTRFRVYRTIQRRALAPERFPSLLSSVHDAPRLQRLVVDGLFGRARPAHLLRPGTLWDIGRALARRAPSAPSAAATQG